MDHKAAPKTLFIINPNAGERKVEKLLRQLKKYQSEISFRITEYPDHAKDIVSSEFGRYDTFVAVGGDGTVNEIASRLVGCNKKLAIYPTGSGNGFAREFGFEKNLNRLMDAIDRGEILKVDVVSLNGMRSFHFSGLGYDSAVAYDFSKRKGRGFWNYVASTVNVIAKYKPIEASVKIDKKIISGRFFMINIANNRQFGYHALIAPKANPTDGEINLVLVSPFKKILFPLFP